MLRRPRSQPRSRWRRRQARVIRQNSNAECAAACLAMILAYHGRKTTVAECRDCISTGRDGVKASVIARVAPQLGLRTRSFSGQPEHFPHVPLPAIVFWEFRHYVVVERWSAQRVVLIDPSAGRRILTSE